MDALVLLFGVCGLVMGSFGNVLLHRIATNKNFGGRSKCPKCKSVIAWFDLIPVLSFLLLGGRCRSCEETISCRYPLVELGSAAVFMAGIILFPADTVLALCTGGILWSLLLLSVYDARHQHIPDLFTIIIGILAVLLIILGYQTLVMATLGLLVSIFWFGLLWIGSRGRAVGTGDIFLAAALGVWLGPWDTLVMLILSYVVGAFVIITMLLSGILKRKKHQRISFGPFLAIGAVLAVMGAGDWYLQMLGM